MTLEIRGQPLINYDEVRRTKTDRKKKTKEKRRGVEARESVSSRYFDLML